MMKVNILLSLDQFETIHSIYNYSKYGVAKAATKALNWLSDINHEANHSNAQKVRDDKTGIWFINSHDFRQWTAGRSSVLWLNAIRKWITTSV